MIANIGLIFCASDDSLDRADLAVLFLVGLETDLSVFKKNARVAGAIATSGLVVPFALGWAVAYGLYNQFIDTTRVEYSTFALFISVALAIVRARCTRFR